MGDNVSTMHLSTAREPTTPAQFCPCKKVSPSRLEGLGNTIYRAISILFDTRILRKKGPPWNGARWVPLFQSCWMCSKINQGGVGVRALVERAVRSQRAKVLELGNMLARRDGL